MIKDSTITFYTFHILQLSWQKTTFTTPSDKADNMTLTLTLKTRLIITFLQCCDTTLSVILFLCVWTNLCNILCKTTRQTLYKRQINDEFYCTCYLGWIGKTEPTLILWCQLQNTSDISLMIRDGVIICTKKYYCKYQQTFLIYSKKCIFLITFRFHDCDLIFSDGSPKNYSKQEK